MQLRYAPSGPFFPGFSAPEGILSRLFFSRGPQQQTLVNEGTGEELVDIQVDIPVGSDLATLAWAVEGKVLYTIVQPEDEDPELFPLSLQLQLQTPVGIPTTVLHRQGTGVPDFPNDDNNPTYNRAAFQYVWRPATFPFAVGTNHVIARLEFFGGGAHQATVNADACSLVLREYKCGTVIIDGVAV
jgi:hypothetical protein